ncbi:hypothetical protein AMTRI_Chr06g179140 [Amborella trichopoda]
MDFIDGLPNSNGKTTIYVAVDRPSKAAHFIPISHPYTATSVAQIFFNHIFKFGLRSCSATLLSYIPGTTQVESVDLELQDRDRSIKQLHEQLQLSQNRMKKVYDAHQTERSFQVGILVYLRLQPYRQVSVALRKNFNLSPRYYGPFEVIQRIVFHVSGLRKKVGTSTVVQRDLPLLSEEDDNMVAQPQAILDHRVKRRQEEVLVHWKGLAPSEATWENLKALKLRFPENTLEDKGDI